jgi:hypothetical protein
LGNYYNKSVVGKAENPEATEEKYKYLIALRLEVLV